ncbi:MAG: hypothetical protein WCT03_05070 [Candidatus Obscuribacterales bacterium]|jgi:uncharacterized membrane protein
MNLPKRTDGEDENPDIPILNPGKTTVFGTPIDTNIASALAYLPLGPLALVAGYVLLNSPSESPSFNRYHAMQGLVFTGAMLAVFVVNNVLAAFLGVIPLLGPLLAIPLGLLGGLLALVYMIVGVKLAFDTYNGKSHKLPYLSKYVNVLLDKTK